VVLFVYSAALPPLLRAGGGRLGVAALIALGLFCLPVPAIAYLDRICGYAVFFVAGLCAAGSANWISLVDRWRWWLLGAFTVALALIVAGVLPGGRPDAAGNRAVLLGVGLLSMPALHGLVRAAPFARSRLLLSLGEASFSIYLLNTILIGLTKGLLLLALPWDASAFPLLAVAMMLAGTLGPIAIVRGLVWGRATAGKTEPPQSPAGSLPAP
jgi:peptidoglycan/LPS O-acetylase OafA/YrhL